jgi:hypothetical protein
VLSSFEARLLTALAALGSVIAHGLMLALLMASPELERSAAVLVELTFQRPAPPPVAGPEAVLADERAKAPSAVQEAAAEEPADASRDFRTRLRRREQAFDAAQRDRHARLLALERHRDEEAAAPLPGEPPVALCGLDGSATPVQVLKHKSLARYAGFTPMGLFPRAYLERAAQVFKRKGGGPSLGRVELALPAEEAVVQLDEPQGTLFALGHRRARCLVGVTWGQDVFPLTFTHIPARYVSADDEVVAVLIDVTLFDDGRFTLSQREGAPIGVEGGALYDREAVARNLQGGAAGAQLVKQIFGPLFGG